MKKQSCWDNYT